MSRELTTAREALLADLLADVDALLQRLEQVDGSIAGRIETAVRDGANKALLASQMRFESMITAQEHRLTDAGRHAAAIIGNELSRHAGLLSLSSAAISARLRMVLPLAFALGIAAGSIGGMVAVRLVGH